MPLGTERGQRKTPREYNQATLLFKASDPANTWDGNFTTFKYTAVTLPNSNNKGGRKDILDKVRT